MIIILIKKAVTVGNRFLPQEICKINVYTQEQRMSAASRIAINNEASLTLLKITLLYNVYQ